LHNLISWLLLEHQKSISACCTLLFLQEKNNKDINKKRLYFFIRNIGLPMI
jgi:hypothetical protein